MSSIASRTGICLINQTDLNILLDLYNNSGQYRYFFSILVPLLRNNMEEMVRIEYFSGQKHDFLLLYRFKGYRWESSIPSTLSFPEIQGRSLLFLSIYLCLSIYLDLDEELGKIFMRSVSNAVELKTEISEYTSSSVSQVNKTISRIFSTWGRGEYFHKKSFHPAPPLEIFFFAESGELNDFQPKINDVMGYQHLKE